METPAVGSTLSAARILLCSGVGLVVVVRMSSESSGQGHFIETQGGEVGKQRSHAVSRIAAGSLFGAGFLCCRL